MDIAEAMFHGAEQRMRPMLMTALSAGIGLFPAAISHGIGSQVQRPLATVVVGGMLIGRCCCSSSCPRFERCSSAARGTTRQRQARMARANLRLLSERVAVGLCV